MRKILALIMIISLSSCEKRQISLIQIIEANQKPKNIILLIGDGMGLAQITAGLYTNNNKLNMERMKVIGLHKSYSGNNLTTDSAAGATVFSCGCKTYNGAIGVKLDTVPCKTILEDLQLKGFTTGLLVTCTITHATPAAFYAHQKSRTLDENIARDLSKSGIDLFIGGGKDFFDKRKLDQDNLITDMTTKGYVIKDAYTNDFLKEAWPRNKKIGFFTATNQPKKLSEGRTYEPEATSKSLEYLASRANGKGFFFMIEGSQIDWGGHDGDSDYIINEVLDFDKVLGRVLDFAEKDKNTLVIVTADHETGGYALLSGSQMGAIKGGFADPGFNKADKHLEHTPCLIPVFAYGPGAELFKGIYENTAIYDKMKQLSLTK